MAEQEARVQAIREVHDRERDRLLRGQQELQEHVYGQQRGVSSHCILRYCSIVSYHPVSRYRNRIGYYRKRVVLDIQNSASTVA